MPVYEYECPKCHHVMERCLTWEEVHELDSGDLGIKCKNCGEVMQKFISLTSKPVIR